MLQNIFQIASILLYKIHAPSDISL